MIRKPLSLGPLVVDRATTSQVLSRIDGLVRHGRGGFVVAPTVDHLMLARRLPRLREAYRRASISIADGRPLLWIARALGRPIPERISGTDFMYTLAERAAARNWGVFLFGASESVSARAAEALTARFPSLRIVGQDSTPWPNSNPRHLIRKIRESGATIVIVGLGCPKQEAWMLQHAHEIKPAMAFGLGDALETVAASVPAASRRPSHTPVEWGIGAVKETHRVTRRLLTRDPKLVPLLISALATRLTGRRAAAVSA